MTARIARWILRLAGWRVVGHTPDMAKYIVIGAPHTSNWDFVIALLLAACFRIELHWMGKHTLFRWPFGYLFRALGGIPIDRRVRGGVVDQVVRAFAERERMVLLITPEGTRKKTAFWKSGFYHIARGAQVPIVLGFVDYQRKITGLGPALVPSGDIHADMRILEAFYTPMRGKYPEAMSDVRVRGDAPPDGSNT